MRVAVDGRSLGSSASSRGVSRYVRSLLEALVRGFPGDEYAVLVPGAAKGLERRSFGLVHGSTVGSRPLFAAGALTGRPRVDRLVGGCDVAFIPAVAPVAVSASVPFVLTVHDLSFQQRPSDFSPYDRVWHRIARPRMLAQRAARVITVSESVRDQVLVEWQLPKSKVVPIPSGPGGETGQPGRRPAGTPDRYVLAVGALEPRKRPDLLVEAHARAREAGLSAGLVFAGDGPMRAELERSHATVLGFVDDAELEALYADALALACVSHDEGFSFTPLEAITRGVPAVVSDLPVFTETLGDGALRVPVGDADALAEALVRLERDGGVRDRLVAAGGAAVSELSWDRAAAQTREVLLDACAG